MPLRTLHHASSPHPLQSNLGAQLYLVEEGTASVQMQYLITQSDVNYCVVTAGRICSIFNQ